MTDWRDNLPTQPLPALPEPWRLLNHECEHGEAFWVTGPDPDSLVAERGCDCIERGAA